MWRVLNLVEDGEAPKMVSVPLSLLLGGDGWANGPQEERAVGDQLSLYV